MIQVRRTGDRDPLKFEVVVSEGKGETRHHVTTAREICERLTAGKHTPERCLEAALRFLLDRGVTRDGQPEVLYIASDRSFCLRMRAKVRLSSE